MTEFEQNLFIAVAKKIKNDNVSLQALSDKVMAEVRAYCEKHNDDGYKYLTDFEKERLTNVRYVLGEISKIKYTKEQLDRAIENNLKRIPGNLADEDKRWELYNVLANLNFKCIYSDTLLVGGKQSIHLDHIIPVNLGGPTDDWNILPICGSCNDSKWKNHLLDWWEKEHTSQDEHKLVYIFEYMANRLLKSLNTKGVKVVTTLTDDEIRKAIELENKERQQEESKQQTIDLEDDIEEDYEDVEEVKDQKIKRLDAITFLYQMLNHIKQNKQYIISPDNLNQGILDTPSDKDKQRLIDKKFRKLEKLFNSIYKQNKRLTGAKTDIQLLDEQRKMVEYIKSLDIVSYYHISYTYFDELQQMLDQGKTDKEIQEFCNSVDRTFNVDIFIQQLQDFMATHDGRYPKFNAEDKVERKLIGQVAYIRESKKGRGNLKLTNEMITKLDKINFIWDGDIVFHIDKFIEDLQIFIKQNNGRYPSRHSKYKEEKKLAGQVGYIRESKKGRGNLKLTNEMITKLDKINFIWEVEVRIDIDKFIQDLQEFIKKHGRYPSESKDSNEEEKKFAVQIQGIRNAKKGKGTNKLTEEMISKLNGANFVWESTYEMKYGDWFTPFCEELEQFIKLNGRYPANSKNVSKSEKKLARQVDSIRQTKKGKNKIRLTEEMVVKLDAIHFAWTGKEQKKKIALFLAEQGIRQGLSA